MREPRSLTRYVLGKWQATHSLYRFVRHLKNWPTIWRAYRAGGPIPSPLQLRCGLTLEFRANDDPIQLLQELFVHSVYTPNGFYRPLPGEIVLDIGANIGWFTLSLLAQEPNLTIHAFEPASASRDLMLRNLQRNHLDGSVTIHAEAVAGTPGVAQLLGGASSLHRSFYAHRLTNQADCEMVPTVPLSEVLKRLASKKVALLKIDAEGSEKDMFAPLISDLLNPVARVVVEFHDHFCPGARVLVEQRLQNAGFRDIRTGHVNPEGTNGILYAQRSG